MTKQDKDEIKEIIHDYITGVIALQNAKYDLIDFKLDSIKEQTTKTNGRVTKLEDEISANDVNMVDSPVAKRIRALEDNQSNIRALKKWIIGSITVVGILMTIFWAIYDIFFRNT